MKFSQSSRFDRLLFAFLFVFVGPAERCRLENFGGAWRTIAVNLRTFKKQMKLLTIRDGCYP
jgi:hypothetical protein